MTGRVQIIDPVGISPLLESVERRNSVAPCLLDCTSRGSGACAIQTMFVYREVMTGLILNLAIYVGSLRKALIYAPESSCISIL